MAASQRRPRTRLSFPDAHDPCRSLSGRKGGPLCVAKKAEDAEVHGLANGHTAEKSHFVHQIYLFSKCLVVTVSRMIALRGPQAGRNTAVG